MPNAANRRRAISYSQLALAKFLNKRGGVSRPYWSMDLQAANEPTNPVVLVVDDDDAARLKARSALEQNGFDVLEA